MNSGMTLESPPRNASEQLDRANRAIADERTAGIKAMQNACGGEFPAVDTVAGAAAIIATLRSQRNALRDQCAKMGASQSAGAAAFIEACGSEFIAGDAGASKNLDGAAKVIRVLKKQRDTLKNQQIAMKEAMDDHAKMIAAAIACVIEGKPLRDGSPLLPVAKLVDSFRTDAASARADATRVTDGLKATLIDRGLTEIPGLVGYLTGATPMLRAAEAASIIAHYPEDRLAREGYLRSRGWVQTGNGWRTPPNHIHLGHLPFDAAVTAQAKHDAEPFKKQAEKLKSVRPVDATAPKGYVGSSPIRQPEEREL